MENLQVITALTVGIVVMSLAPALVWTTVVAGLYQIAKDRVREANAGQREIEYGRGTAL